MSLKVHEFKREEHVYANDEFAELLKDAVRFFHGTPVLPLPPETPFDGARIYAGHTGSDVSRPSKTIKAGAHGVPGGENMLRFGDGSVRYMTVHEAKLIQTFPPDFKVAGTWGEAMRQIGNAVPVKLAEIVGSQLRKTLEETFEVRKIAV